MSGYIASTHYRKLHQCGSLLYKLTVMFWTDNTVLKQFLLDMLLQKWFGFNISMFVWSCVVLKCLKTNFETNICGIGICIFVFIVFLYFSWPLLYPIIRSINSVWADMLLFVFSTWSACQVSKLCPLILLLWLCAAQWSCSFSSIFPSSIPNVTNNISIKHIWSHFQLPILANTLMPLMIRSLFISMSWTSRFWISMFLFFLGGQQMPIPCLFCFVHVFTYNRELQQLVWKLARSYHDKHALVFNPAEICCEIPWENQDAICKDYHKLSQGRPMETTLSRNAPYQL